MSQASEIIILLGGLDNTLEVQEHGEFCSALFGVNEDLSEKLKQKVAFVKNLAQQLGMKIADLATLFTDLRVFKFFQRIGWSFKRLYKLLTQGFNLANQVADIIAKWASNHKVLEWSDKNLKKLDQFLRTHPRLKRIAGFGAAGILAFIWFNMTFTGNPKYDFDMSNLVSALEGKISFIDVFGGVSGAKLLTLFTTGASLGLTFPWPGPDKIQFVIAVLGTIATKLNKKITTRVSKGDYIAMKEDFYLSNSMVLSI